VPKNIFVIRDSGLLIGATNPVEIADGVDVVEVAVDGEAGDGGEDGAAGAGVFNLLQPAAKTKISENRKIIFLIWLYYRTLNSI
jgi:hypothetical protein